MEDLRNFSCSLKDDHEFYAQADNIAASCDLLHHEYQTSPGYVLAFRDKYDAKDVQSIINDFQVLIANVSYLQT